MLSQDDSFTLLIRGQKTCDLLDLHRSLGRYLSRYYRQWKDQMLHELYALCPYKDKSDAVMFIRGGAYNKRVQTVFEPRPPLPYLGLFYRGISVSWTNTDCSTISIVDRRLETPVEKRYPYSQRILQVLFRGDSRMCKVFSFFLQNHWLKKKTLRH